MCVCEGHYITTSYYLQTRDIKVVCEPSVLEEELIKQEDFKDIADQLITWDDSK